MTILVLIPAVKNQSTLNPSKYREWHWRTTVPQRAVFYNVQCHMAGKIILVLISGISGMLQGAETRSPAKRDNYKWSCTLSVAKLTCRKEHHDSK